jgi:phosphatidylglycerol lysyltransferase
VRARRLFTGQLRRKQEEVVELSMDGGTATHQREQVAALINRHGWNATSFQTLEDGYRYFFHAGGCVAYVDTSEAWVVAGAPIAAYEGIPEVLRAFLKAARHAERRVSLFGVEQRLLDLAQGSLKAVKVGEQPVWDPSDWQQTLARRRSVREQLRRARAKGVVVRELSRTELESAGLRAEISAVARRWLAGRRLPPLGFLLRLELFNFAHERRCFVAEQGGRIVGVAGVVPVPARAGWFVEDLLRDPHSPSGTGELLVDAAMRGAAAAGSRWLTLGLAPLAGDVPPLLLVARHGGELLYGFEGLRRYKAKLEPRSWHPLYVAYPPEQSSIRSLLDAWNAFTGTGLLGFGWRALQHQSAALGRLARPLIGLTEARA